MNKDIAGSLTWAASIIVLALAASFARKQGYIDQDTTTRIVMGAIGSMVAWFGNRMPKTFVANASARKVARVGGWSMALSGLVYAGLWAFAPFDAAVLMGCAAVLTGIIVTAAYSFALRSQAKAN